MKKLLALVLALVMTLGLATVGANAAFADADKIEHTEAVEVLNSLDIIGGKENNNFDPTGDVKRSEMAKMVAIAILGDVDVSAFTGAPTDLTDINGHWAEGYIKFCVAQKIVGGRGNGKFDPDANVTTTEAAKMLLVAMGYSSDVRGYTGEQWQVNVTKDAQLKGLFDKLSGLTANHALNRDETAQMVYNTLTATRVIETQQIDTKTGAITLGYSDATNASSGGRTLLTKTFSGTDQTGRVVGRNYSAKDKEWTYTINPDDGSANYTVVSDKDYTEFYGLNVRALSTWNDKEKENVLAGMYLHDSVVLREGYFGEIESVTIAAGDQSVKIDGTTYRLDSTAGLIDAVRTNRALTDTTLDLDDFGTPAAPAMLAQLGAGVTGHYSYKLIDYDGNNKVDLVYITPFTIGKVTYVGSDSITVSLQNGDVDADVSGNKKLADIDIYDGVAKDDYVLCTNSLYSSKLIPTYTKLDIASGTLTGTRNGGAEFKLGNSWLANATATALNVNDTIDYINLGPVFYYAKVTSGATGSDAVAVVVKIADYTGTGVSGNYVQAKLLLADGSSVTGKVIYVNGYKLAAADSILTTVTGTDASGNAPTAANSAGAPFAFNALEDQLVRYEKNSSGELSLWTIPANYDAAAAGTNILGYSGTLGKAATFDNTNDQVGGREVADDAIVFVVQGTNDKAKVISGRELKNTTAGTFGIGGTTFASGLYGKKDGFTYAQVVVLQGGTAYPTINTGSNYAYLVADAYTSKEDGTNYRYFEFWDGEKVVTAKEKDETSLTGLVAGVIITYDETGTEGVVKNVSAPSLGIGPVTGWDGTKKIQITGSNRTEINSDTVVLYINSADQVGVAGGAISEAVDLDGDGSKDANVMFLDGGNKAFALVVVDVNQDMQGNAAQTSSILAQGDAGTSTPITSALASQNVTVNVTSAYAPTGAIAIPSGKTLTIESDDNDSITLASVTFGDTKSKLVIKTEGTVDLGSTATIDGVVDAKGSTVTMDDTGITVTGTLKVTGDLACTGQTIANSGSITVSGDLTSGTVTQTAGNLTIGGTAATTINASAGNVTFNYDGTTAVTALGLSGTGTAYIGGGSTNGLTITTLTNTGSGKVTVGAGSKLTVTNATTAAAAESIVGAGAGAQLTLGTITSDTTTNNTNTATNTAKFFDDAGTAGTTNAAVTTALAGNKIAADDYTWGTAYVGTSGGTAIQAWIAT